jgi:biotin carboxyl carrier protein
VKFDVTVNGRGAKLAVDNGRVRYSAEAGECDAEYSITPTAEAQYSILIAGRSYQATVLAGGEVSVNGRVYRVEVFDPRGLGGRKRGAAAEGRQTLAAPMPGRVIRVLVEPGQDVAAGQGLIVVEAMKMQNEMKSPKDGRVVEVKTAAGAAVAAGEVLVIIE